MENIGVIYTTRTMHQRFILSDVSIYDIVIAEIDSQALERPNCNIA